MKRLFKLLFNTVIVLLLLPLFVVFGLFIYGNYFNPDFEQTMKDMTEFLEMTGASGNGFGGEEGFKVLDSKFKSSKSYFWLDNKNLAFRTDFGAGSPKDVQRNYVWNTEDDSIKPLELEGPIICSLEEKLYYSKPSEAKTLPNGKLKGQVYQSELREIDDRWIVDSSQKIDSIWTGPPEGYDLYWSNDCQPHFLEKTGYRSENRSSLFRIKFASEWGWILRVPRVPPKSPVSKIPRVGFYDLDGEAYFGQTGQKIAELPPALNIDITNLHLVYVDFLDEYLIANKLYGDRAKSKVLELVDRNGNFQHIAALDDWPAYTDLPMPTRKGIFWSGKDYRSKSHSQLDVGTYLQDGGGRIYKVAGGEAFSPELSNDGCSVAYYNPPQNGKDKGSLKVLKVCNSTLNGKELQNVDY
jgi:hypothetical protein